MSAVLRSSMPNRTISKLAEEASVHVETIRYYERIGLIEQPRKPRYGWRVYGDDVLASIRFIKRAQQLGMTLDEVNKLLHWRAATNADVCGEVAELGRQKLEEVQKELDELTLRRDRLRALVQATPAHGTPAECELIAALDRDLE